MTDECQPCQRLLTATEKLWSMDSYLLIHEGQIFDKIKIFLSIKETPKSSEMAPDRTILHLVVNNDGVNDF
jgi:hypothetical protein